MRHEKPVIDSDIIPTFGNITPPNWNSVDRKIIDVKSCMFAAAAASPYGLSFNQINEFNT